MTVSAPEPGPPDSPGAVKIVAFGGNLYTATGQPLYRYMPLAQMSRRGQPVPWAKDWDDYITAWVHTYVPLPKTTSSTPAINKGGLSYQDRTGAGSQREYQQATYRGWPLYLCDLDTPDFNMAPQGTVPGLFEMVSVCEPPVVWNAEQTPATQYPDPDSEPPDLGWPYILSGP